VAYARALHEASLATGFTIAVTGRSGVVWSDTVGLRNQAAGRPVTPDTLFEIGSISKGLTCALLLQARDAGLIDLDAPATEYLPWFEVRTRFAPVTLRHLMTHTAGIVTGNDFSGDAAFEVWSLRDTEATAPPGTWFYYSNVGYKALGLVLEAVWQRPFHRLLTERLLIPLGMNSSIAAITHEVRSRIATGYERDPAAKRGRVPATWLETATADGSIAATAVDMTAWIRHLLKPESAEMLVPAIAMPDPRPGAGYGLGMMTGEIDGFRHAWHTGVMVGYYAALACDLDNGAGAVVLANGEGPWLDMALHALAAERTAETPAFIPPEPDPEPDPAETAQAAETKAEWAALTGYYTCHNPWLPSMRVYIRDGSLRARGGEGDEPLVPLPDGSFRVGADDRSPERARFDTVLNGTATRAVFSGCALYRTFTS
jgi:CubicO group peptidase (beta-lactamase class C family)